MNDGGGLPVYPGLVVETRFNGSDPFHSEARCPKKTMTNRMITTMICFFTGTNLPGVRGTGSKGCFRLSELYRELRRESEVPRQTQRSFGSSKLVREYEECR